MVGFVMGPWFSLWNPGRNILRFRYKTFQHTRQLLLFKEAWEKNEAT
jgi:hypothetical protein